MPRASSAQSPIIVWFRQDLRLADNPALAAAVAEGAPVIPLYILDDKSAGDWRMGGASRWWLHHSLAALDGELRKHGSRLTLRRGEAHKELQCIVGETGARAVLWNRLYEPWTMGRDKGIKSALTKAGLRAESFNAGLLFEPWTIATKGKEPYRVFTPFWRACLAAAEPPAPTRAPREIAGPPRGLRSDDRASWDLTPRKPDWAAQFAKHWTPGEAGARTQINGFVRDGIADYGRARDIPAEDGSSRLSPHLHFGEIGPRQIWHRVQSAVAAGDVPGRAGEGFLREIGWREFSHHLLYHFPHMPERALHAGYDDFPWRRDPKGLRAWQRGLTGYPIVDAGMRQLWQTGCMHNRVRMVVGSFLVKHLLLPWRAGEDWFWDTLVDADLANNAQNWQWVAGCGADAAPYFRVFNPVLQGEKFDPDGTYVRRWVPELARLPARVIHKPWTASAEVLAEAKVELGKTYPAPIVDHKAGRERALAAWRRARGDSGKS